MTAFCALAWPAHFAMLSKLVHLFLVEHNCAMAARRPVVVVAVAFGSTAVAMVVAVVIIIASPRKSNSIIDVVSV